MRKLSIEIWESSSDRANNSDTRCGDIRPMLIVCDDRLTVQDLWELVRTKYEEMHPGKPKLRIKWIADGYGSVLTCDLAVGMVWEDRTRVSNPKEFTVQVFRERPTQEELRTFGGMRLASIAPESSARPQKRPRASIPGYQTSASYGYPFSGLGNEYQSKRQKIMNGALEQTNGFQDPIRSVEGNLPIVENVAVDPSASPIVIVDSQQSPGRNVTDASTLQTPTESQESPKSESPELESSAILSVPQSKQGTPHTQPTAHPEPSPPVVAKPADSTQIANAPSARQHGDVFRLPAKPNTPKNTHQQSPKVRGDKSPRSLVSSAKALRVSSVEKGSIARPRADLFEFVVEESNHATPARKKPRISKGHQATGDSVLSRSRSASHPGSQDQNISPRARQSFVAKESMMSILCDSESTPKPGDQLSQSRTDHLASHDGGRVKKLPEICKRTSFVEDNNGMEIHPYQARELYVREGDESVPGRLDAESEHSSKEQDHAGSLSTSFAKASPSVAIRKEKFKNPTSIRRASSKAAEVGDENSTSDEASERGAKDTEASNRVKSFKTPTKTDDQPLEPLKNGKSHKLTPLVPGSGGKQNGEKNGKPTAVEKLLTTPTTKVTPKPALKTKGSLLSLPPRSVSFDADTMVSVDQAGSAPLASIPKTKKSPRTPASSAKARMSSGQRSYFNQLFLQPIPAEFVNLRKASPTPVPMGPPKMPRDTQFSISAMDETPSTTLTKDPNAKSSTNEAINGSLMKEDSNSDGLAKGRKPSKQNLTTPRKQGLVSKLQGKVKELEDTSDQIVCKVAAKPLSKSRSQSSAEKSREEGLSEASSMSQASSSRISTPQSNINSNSRSPAREVPSSASASTSSLDESSNSEDGEAEASGEEVVEDGEGSRAEGVKEDGEEIYEEAEETEESEDEEKDEKESDSEYQSKRQIGKLDRENSQHQKAGEINTHDTDGAERAHKGNISGVAAQIRSSSTERSEGSDQSNISDSDSDSDSDLVNKSVLPGLPKRAGKDTASQEGEDAERQLQIENTQSMDPHISSPSRPVKRFNAATTPRGGSRTPSIARPGLANAQFPSFSNLKSKSFNVRTPPVSRGTKQLSAYDNPLKKSSESKEWAETDSDDEEDDDDASSPASSGDEGDDGDGDLETKNKASLVGAIGSSQGKGKGNGKKKSFISFINLGSSQRR